MLCQERGGGSRREADGLESCTPLWPGHQFSWRAVAEFRFHVEMAPAMELALAQGAPVELLEEFFVLLLHVGEEAVAADSVGGGDGFVDQPGPEGTGAAVDGEVIAHADAGAELGKLPEGGGNLEI